MKNPMIVFIALLVFAALVAVAWTPSWMFGIGGGVLSGGFELGGGLFGIALGLVGAVIGILAAMVAILIAVPLALIGVVGALLFAAAVVAVVLLGLAAPLLVPVLLVWAIVWLARRSGPPPPVPVHAVQHLPARLDPAR